jgi:sugar phosphate isomerase/epimerase
MTALGIFSWFGYALPIRKRLELIAAAGFESTCLWLGVEEELVAASEPDRMSALAHGLGLTIDNVHAPYVGCNALWTESDAHAVFATYDAAIAFCHRHRIPVTVIHVTQGSRPPPKGDAGLERIRELARRAGEKDVVLAIENCARPDYVDFLLSECDAHSLGLCYDSSHDFLNGNRSVEILKRWGHRLITTHFSDNLGEKDDHLLPGDGTIDWEGVSDGFPAKTYTGPVLLEVYPAPGNRIDAESFLREAHGRAKQLAEKLGQPPL